jgi:arylsulfatase A
MPNRSLDSAAMRLHSPLCIAILAATAAAQAPTTSRGSKPNIVLILADDMGYGDVHALNPTSKIATPNLDGLAAAGMSFTDAHTPSAVCTPTRYGALTGRYCWRGRLKRGVINGYGKRVIENGRQTIGHMLRDAGYHTGIVGKWHLGLDWPKSPADRKRIDFTKPIGDVPNVLGFDSSYIIPASLDFPPYVYIRDGKVTDPRTVVQPKQGFPAFLRRGPRAKDFVMADALDHLTSQATSYIRARAETGRPFFLYFPLTAPHKPALPHKRFRGKSGMADYGDFVVQVDYTVGEILRVIEESGIAGDTIVIYTSDNGSYMHRYDETGKGAEKKDHTDDAKIQGYRAANHRANGPLRGTKADIFEAGHRVPFFVRWPGKVAKGSKCDTTICLTDFMATFAELTGATMTRDMGEDSFSFLALARGKKPGVGRPPVIHHSANGMFAIRIGRWKLVAGNGSGGRAKPRGKPFGTPFQLFDISADIAEAKNVIGEHPGVARRLAEALTRIRVSGRSGGGARLRK